MSMLRGFRVQWTECTVLASNERCVIQCTGTTSVDAVEAAINLTRYEIRLPPGFGLHTPTLRLQRDSVDTVKLDAQLEYTGADVRDATAHFVGSVWDLQTGSSVARGLGRAPVVLGGEDPREGGSGAAGSTELSWRAYELNVHVNGAVVSSPPRGFGRFYDDAVLGPATHSFDIAELERCSDGTNSPRLKLGPIYTILDAARATRGLEPLSDFECLVRRIPRDNGRCVVDASTRANAMLENNNENTLAEAEEIYQLTRFRFRLTCAPMLPCEDGLCDLRVMPAMSVRFVRVLTPGDWTLYLERDAGGVPCPYNVMVDLAPLATNEDATSLLTGRCPKDNGISFHMREHPVLRGRLDCRRVTMQLFGTTVATVVDCEIPLAGLLFC
jgi:hypothetical protein